MYIGIEFCCEVEGEVGFGEISWELGLVVIACVDNVFEMDGDGSFDEMVLMLSLSSISFFVHAFC